MEQTAIARRRWAYSLIHRATSPLPIYGNAEWLSLPERDARKIGAVVVAAECWATAGENLPDDLRAELIATRLQTKRLDDADYQARAEAHRIRTLRQLSVSDVRTFSERRAEQMKSAAPRPGDFKGRGSAP